MSKVGRAADGIIRFLFSPVLADHRSQGCKFGRCSFGHEIHVLYIEKVASPKTERKHDDDVPVALKDRTIEMRKKYRNASGSFVKEIRKVVVSITLHTENNG